MERKPIQVSDRSHEIFRLEAARLSMKPNTVKTMRAVLEDIAELINKKRKYLKGGR